MSAFGRRSLLRGFGGLVVALPALEIFGRGVARAAGPAPTRYAYFFAANNTMVKATGYPGPIPLELGTPAIDKCLRLIAPKNAGRNYDLAASMGPIGPTGFAVQDDISVVSDLTIPWGMGASSIPPGGRYYHYHTSTVIPQTTGLRCPEFDFGATHEPKALGPTHDQIMAGIIGQNTLVSLVNLGVQADRYPGGTGYNNARISWKFANGVASWVDNVVSPHLAYRILFPTGAVPGTDPKAAAEANALLQRRKSVLDLVDRSSDRLLRDLGKVDAERVQKHFDEIRSLEKRIATLGAAGGAGCVTPADPTDPATIGKEGPRAELMTDLLAMAFACNITRVGTIQLAWTNSVMNVGAVVPGSNDNVHNVSHKLNWTTAPGQDPRNAPASTTVKFQEWQIKQYARFVKKLKDTPDVDGKTVLDNSAIALGFEGGYGHDPESNFDTTAHSSERMCVLVAGRAGGLKPGQHVKGAGRHPASVMLSAMKAAGHTGNFGDITTPINELFT